MYRLDLFVRVSSFCAFLSSPVLSSTRSIHTVFTNSCDLEEKRVALHCKPCNAYEFISRAHSVSVDTPYLRK